MKTSHDNNRIADIFGLIGWLAATFVFAAIGARFLPGEWYRALTKPALTPPDFIFAPVWTLLYILMALAAWLVWRQGGFKSNRLALSLYGAQLVLNALWSWIFFGQHQIGFALIDILVLLSVIILTAIKFHTINRHAAILMTPYILWVTFATYLNFELWRLN